MTHLNASGKQDYATLLEIAGKFHQLHHPVSIKPIGSGHIHDTFLVVDSTHMEFILQRINTKIFTKVDGMMGNIRLVTHVLLKQTPLSVKLLHTHDGHTTVSHYTGIWRAMEKIPGCITYDKINDPRLAAEAGRALGLFHWLLKGLPSEALFETLPNFHNLTLRHTALVNAVQKAAPERNSKAQIALQFVKKHIEELLVIDNLINTKTIPLRVVHNDPKINNILFNQQGEALCMIDLDTVMAGSLLHDFGDAIRTTCALANEDEPDVSKCGLDLDLLKAYTRGYLNQTAPMISNLEKTHLSIAPAVLSFTIGIRFLTDYLENDSYYKIQFPEHNLIRANAQFAQTLFILDHQKQIEEMIKAI